MSRRWAITMPAVRCSHCNGKNEKPTNEWTSACRDASYLAQQPKNSAHARCGLPIAGMVIGGTFLDTSSDVLRTSPPYEEPSHKAEGRPPVAFAAHRLRGRRNGNECHEKAGLAARLPWSSGSLLTVGEMDELTAVPVGSSQPHFLSDIELDVSDKGIQSVSEVGMADLL